MLQVGDLVQMQLAIFAQKSPGQPLAATGGGLEWHSSQSSCSSVADLQLDLNGAQDKTMTSFSSGPPQDVYRPIYLQKIATCVWDETAFCHCGCGSLWRSFTTKSLILEPIASPPPPPTLQCDHTLFLVS